MPKKLYVCTSCGAEYTALPYAAECDRDVTRQTAWGQKFDRCGGRCRAALVCECGQWAWSALALAPEPVYMCLHGHLDGRVF